MVIIFSRSSSVLSRIIRFFDKGKWSHVAIKVDEHHILDSRFPKGVKVRHFDLTDYEFVEVDGDIEKALNHVGKKYDLLRFIWYGFEWGDKPWNNPNEMICSELIAESVNDENLKGMTPNEQYKYLRSE
ncbi:hypothetical protein SAMN05192534_12382 [Alteribacillus persepolensis]|uniref:Permuted papain-like amidase enzyme, YaeF/YiiX, C92 family n=1 Tax=Alteribacillus persepolensis TaxID=568899 RepID=A0A1G8IC01_9BACI|nr:hypothetical protein [Alteribacillus persepolensis]SDI16413.1 hypothetical protein SAMN05192534_12382 [Alteribacillus persepolensis]